MRSESVATNPLNVLVIVSDPHTDVAPFLSALRAHFTLVCPLNARTVPTAQRFEPDVVMVDGSDPDLLTLPASALGAAGPVFVALTPSAEAAPTVPAGFHHILPLPATASEVEHLMWRILGGGAVRRLAQTGNEKTA
jgi:hypothetical protein